MAQAVRTMNAPAPTEPEAVARSEPPPPDWRVRTASGDDTPAIAAAVRDLLLELGGTPAPALALEAATRGLLEDRRSGALLVADAEEAIVGVLGASWQSAIHIPGRYALIQELWVHPSWRGRAVGSDLLAALFELAREQSIARIEVGLPQERFPGIRATEAFYLRNGFTPLGARMRRTLA
jgi:GNAT superfamily N-acetyltransferase